MSRRYGKKWRYSAFREAPTDENMVRLENISKNHIAERLADFGFTTADISDSSPFDILATSPYYSLAIDIRYRWSKSRISIHKHQVIARVKYKLDVDDKLLVFCTPNLVDSYISLNRLYKTLESSSCGIYIVGEYYIVERYTTSSLSTLRKILESSKYL